MSKFTEYLEGTKKKTNYMQSFIEFQNLLTKLNLDEDFKFRKDFIQKVKDLQSALIEVKVELPNYPKGNLKLGIK